MLVMKPVMQDKNLDVPVIFKCGIQTCYLICKRASGQEVILKTSLNYNSLPILRHLANVIAFINYV